MWMNIYQTANTIEDNPLVGFIYDLREHADRDAGPRRLACIPVHNETIWNATGITLIRRDD